MAEGQLKRVQPDLVREIEGYSGGSFSEKMVKWKNDVNTLTQDGIEEAMRSELKNLYLYEGEIRLE